MSEEDNRFSLKALARGAGIGMIGSLAGYAFMFLFKIVAARYFGSEAFGMFTFGNTLLGIFTTVSLFGLNGGITRYVPFYERKGEREKLRGYLTFVLSYPLIFSCILATATWFLAGSITGFFNFPNQFTTLLKILAFAIPFRALCRIGGELLLAKKEVLLDTIGYSFIEQALLLLGTLSIIFFELSIVHLFILFALTISLHALFDVFVYYVDGITLDVGPTSSYETKEWLRFSLPLFFNGIFGFIFSWADQLIIGKVMTASDVGIYSIAFSMGTFLGMIQGSFGDIFNPLISEHYAERDINKIQFLFKKSAAWIFGLSFPIYLIMVVYAEQVLNLVFGRTYATGYIPMIIVATGVLINVSTGLCQNIVNLYKKTNLTFWIKAGAAILNLALNLVLIPFLGLMGAALASAGSVALQNLLFLYSANNLVSLSFDTWYYIKFVLAGIPAAVLGDQVFKLGVHPYIELSVSGVVYGGSYLVFLVLLKTFTEDDKVVLQAVEEKIGMRIPYARLLFRD